MKKTIKNPIFILVLVFVLTFGISCGGGGSSITTGGTTTAVQDGLNGAVGYIPSSTLPSDAGGVSIYNISLSNLTGHSVYAVASNQLINHSRTNEVKFYDNSVRSVVSSEVEDSDSNAKTIIDFIPKFDVTTEEKVDRSSTYLSSSISPSYSEGNTKSFKVYKYYVSEDKFRQDVMVNAVLVKRNIVSGKGINIWVDSNLWDSSDGDKQDIVDYISKKFLLDGRNDIYSWVTDIFGDSYSDPSESNLITESDINIILYNINSFYSSKGARTLGYFNGEDVYYSVNSNRINGFYVDFYSLLDSDEFWKDMAKSTVAHEFLHSVVFYQRYIKKGIWTATWLNEMLAMVTEDILSKKLDLMGPKGTKNLDGSGTNISYGRLSSANGAKVKRVSFAESGDNFDYSTEYAFGAYLLRNYGTDLSVFKRIVQSDLDGFDAIESAIGNVSKSYDLVLNNAKAMILSQQDFSSDNKYRYSNGATNGFTVTTPNNSFQVGSINLYNYQTKPYIYALGATPSALNRASSLLFNLATNKTGSFNVNLSLPNYTKVEIIVLDSSGNYDVIKSGQVNVEKIE